MNYKGIEMTKTQAEHIKQFKKLSRAQQIAYTAMIYAELNDAFEPLENYTPKEYQDAAEVLERAAKRNVDPAPGYRQCASAALVLLRNYMIAQIMEGLAELSKEEQDKILSKHIERSGEE